MANMINAQREMAHSNFIASTIWIVNKGNTHENVYRMATSTAKADAPSSAP